MFAASSAATSAGERCIEPRGCSSPPVSCTACSMRRMFDDAPVLRWSYVAVGAVGLAFYAYRELLARFFLSLHDYQVEAVSEIDEGLVEVALRPIGRAIDFVPGQFAMIYLEAKDGWHRHPFTISSSPHEDVVRVTVKALGDYTSRLRELIEPGMLAVIGGPRGRFSHWTWNPASGVDRRGRRRRAVPELAACARWSAAASCGLLLHRRRRGAVRRGDPRDRGPPRSLHAHLIDTAGEGRLTSERVLAVAGGDPRELSVFMCGPRPMVRSFQSQLRLAGVPSRRIHREHFDWR